MEKKRKAIVFIHGFLGCKKQFNGIKELLDGCGADFIDHSVSGHTGPLEDFLESNDTTWQNGLDEHLKQLREEYDELCLVGHSMGGLLAVCAAVDSPEKICGIAAIAFPVKIHLTLSWAVCHYYASRKKRDGESPRITAARSLCGVKIRNTRELIRVTPNSVRLLKLIKKTRANIPKLSMPLLVLNSGKDEIVSKSAASFVKKNLPEARVFTIKDSYHFYFTGEGEKIIAEAIREMIK